MKRFIASLLFLCCGMTAVKAQTDNLSASAADSATVARLTADVARLSADVARLSGEMTQEKAHTSSWEKIRARLPKVAGYIQAGYEGAIGETNTSSFMVRSVRVWAIGNFAPKFDYMVHMELVSPRLLDAFIRYRPFDALGVQVGEFKIPFTIENTEYIPTRAELVEMPLAVMRLTAIKGDHCGIAASGRDLGAMVSGSFFKRDDRHLLTYEVALLNGEGINTWDKNNSKDFSGRLMFRPVSGLTIAGYYYWGEYGEKHLKRIRYGGGFAYDRPRGVIRGEYLGGVTGVADRGNFDSDGWYLLGGIRPVKKLMIAARYDTFAGDKTVSATRQTNYTAGLTWEPIKQLRCQLNYTYEEYAASDAYDRNVVLLMFTGIF